MPPSTWNFGQKWGDEAGQNSHSSNANFDFQNSSNANVNANIGIYIVSWNVITGLIHYWITRWHSGTLTIIMILWWNYVHVTYHSGRPCLWWARDVSHLGLLFAHNDTSISGLPKHLDSSWLNCIYHHVRHTMTCSWLNYSQPWQCWSICSTTRQPIFSAHGVRYQTVVLFRPRGQNDDASTVDHLLRRSSQC